MRRTGALAKAEAEAVNARLYVPEIIDYWRTMYQMGMSPPKYLTPFEVRILKQLEVIREQVTDQALAESGADAEDVGQRVD